jgi:hypothetical protein
VRHDHQAMRAAAGGGFIVILRNEFRDGLGEFLLRRCLATVSKKA